MNIKRAIGGPLLSIVFLIFFAYMIAGGRWIMSDYLKNYSEKALGDISKGVQTVAPLPTAQLDIKAASAISVESNLKDVHQIIYDKDANVRLPIASLTKLMTAVVVLDNYNLSDVVSVGETADSQDAMKVDVKAGDTMSVESLLDIMIVESSNKSAYALAEGPQGKPGEQKFVQLMNQKASDLGLSNTVFVDPTGLSPYNVSTAEDLARLAEYILKNYPKIANISKVKNFYVPNFGYITNTDQLLDNVPGVACSKTGFTTAAKGCLLLVMNNLKNNDYLINIILGADDRFAEMKKIVDWQMPVCVSGN